MAARERYSDREAFFVSDPNIEDGFVEPIVLLLKDHSLRKRMGNAPRERAKKLYSYEVIMPQTRGILQEATQHDE